MSKSETAITAPVIDARTADIEDLWKMSEGSVIVTMDDGNIVTTLRRTIYCWYLWEIHRRYPETPLLCSHHMGMQRMTSKIHLKLLGEIYKDWCDVYPASAREDAWKLIYEIGNHAYNTFIQRLDSYVSTLSILDILEVLDHPVIAEANASVKPTQSSIDETYDIIDKTLMEAPELSDNAIANMARSSMVDIKQINQVLGPRGFVTEIDSTIFKLPITTGFAHGVRQLYDHMIESRSASKALSFAKDPLAMCEYFNRKLQLVGESVMRLVPGDCGSQHYMTWRVEANELRNMEGIHYVENGEVKAIERNDFHLEGELLSLRTPFGCILPDRQSVCETCYGRMAASIPAGTNPGHVAGTAIGEKTSQLVLSTKHVEGSSKVDDVDLGEPYDQYLVPGAENNVLRLHSDLKGVPVKLVIKAEYLKALPDIDHIDNLHDVAITRISEISEIRMLVGDADEEGGVHEMTVPTSMGSRKGSLTVDALYYLKVYPPMLDDDGNYVIDLKHWNVAYSLFELPLKHINMLDFQDQVEQVIFSGDKQIGLASKLHESPTDAVKSLMALVTSKIHNINLSHLMTMAYAVSAVDPKNSDYRLPRGGEPFQFASLTELMAGRSLGATMAYERQYAVFEKPESYILQDRPRHPMDELLLGSSS